MTPLTVNLKIFYQRKGLWFWYVIILAQLPSVLLFSRKTEFGNKQYCLIVPILLGMLVGTLQKELMCRPVTFCLPGGRTLYRKIIFGIGIVTSSLMALLLIPMIPSHNLLLAVNVVTFGIIFLSAYLFSAQFSYHNNTGKPSWQGTLWVIIFLSVFFGGYLDLWERIIQMPWLFLITLSLYCCYCWSLFDPEKHARTFCGCAQPGLSGNWGDRSAIRKYVAEIQERKRPCDGRMGRLERTALAMMQTSSITSTTQNTIGATYSVLGGAFTFGIGRFIFLLLLMIVFFGYFMGTSYVGQRNIGQFQINVIFVMPAIGAMMWILPVHPSLHIPCDRVTRFKSSLFAMIALTLATTFLLTLVVLLANLAEPFMPVLPWFGSTGADYKAPKLFSCYLIPMFMPLGFAAGTLFGRRQTVFIFMGPIIFFLAIGLTAVQTFTSLSWYYAPILTGVIWSIFILILHKHCLSGNLVGPYRE